MTQTPDLPVEIVETAESHNTPVLLGVVDRFASGGVRG